MKEHRLIYLTKVYDSEGNLQDERLSFHKNQYNQLRTIYGKDRVVGLWLDTLRPAAGWKEIS